MYEKWINFPTITSILQTNYPISNIPFPAVTICSNNKVFRDKLRDTVDNENGPLKGAKQKLGLNVEDFEMTLANVLRRYIYYDEEKDIEYDIQTEENINQFYMLNNYSSKMSEVLQSAMLSCDEMIVVCQWKGVTKSCAELFTISKSDSGFCCSFNIIKTDELLAIQQEEAAETNDEEELSGEGMQNRIKTSQHREFNVKKSDTANSLFGLSVVLNGNRREYNKWPVEYLQKNNYYGFKVRLNFYLSHYVLVI